MIMKILLGKWAMDAHDRGVKTIAHTLRDAGFEVVFTRFEFPSEAVRAAEEEDVDIIGISCSMGEHSYFASEILRLMGDRKMKGIPLIFGGVISPNDSRELLCLGVKAVFGPGTSLQEVSKHIHDMKVYVEKERQSHSS
ncbi:MAG: cobalamin-dependent protein [Thermodesulfobacteriota bacterium]